MIKTWHYNLNFIRALPSVTCSTVSSVCARSSRRAPACLWDMMRHGRCLLCSSAARWALVAPTLPWSWAHWSWIAWGVIHSRRLSKDSAPNTSGKQREKRHMKLHYIWNFFVFSFNLYFTELRRQQLQRPNHCSRSSSLWSTSCLMDSRSWKR